MNYNPRFNHVLLLLLLLYKDDTLIISKPMMVASSIVSIPIKVFGMYIIVIQRCLHQEKERKTWNHIQHQFISRLYSKRWYLVHQLHYVA